MNLYSVLWFGATYGPYVTNKGITQFYLPPHTNHTCLYCPAVSHHCPLAGTHCTYPRKDGQADLGDWLHTKINVPYRQLNLDTITIQVLTGPDIDVHCWPRSMRYHYARPPPIITNDRQSMFSYSCLTVITALSFLRGDTDNINFSTLRLFQSVPVLHGHSHHTALWGWVTLLIPDFCPHNIVKHGICYGKVCPSVCLLHSWVTS